MLVKFTIEPDALSDAEYDHILNLLKNHWRPYGILVFMVSILDNAILNCDHNVGDLLKESYKHFRSNGYPLWMEANNIDWENIDTPDDLARYHSKFELALIKETRASEFGVPKYKTKYCGSVETAELRNVSASAKFDAAYKLANGKIEDNQPISDLWSERFQGFAKVSKQVTIVDRYAAYNFYDGKNELLNLFKFIEKDSSNCYVTIYSSPDANRYHQVNLSEIEEKLKNEVSKLGLKNIEKVTLHMTPNRVFSDLVHERYIRFDKITCGIDIGIQVFRHNTTRASNFHFKSSQFIHDSQSTEKKLRDERSDHFTWNT